MLVHMGVSSKLLLVWAKKNNWKLKHLLTIVADDKRAGVVSEDPNLLEQDDLRS